MSNMQNNSKNQKSVNITEKKNINETMSENISFQKQSNESILNDSENLIDSKNILLNTFVNVTVELGRSKIKIKDFLKFSKGSMLILDKLKKEPLDIFINSHLIASGEIVMLEKKYGLRITKIKKSLKTINILS